MINVARSISRRRNVFINVNRAMSAVPMMENSETAITVIEQNRTHLENPQQNASAKTALYSCGVGAIGALGFGDFKSRANPQINPILKADNVRKFSFTLASHIYSLSLESEEQISPVTVSAGWGHCAVVDDEGILHMWGRTHDSTNILFLARWGTTLPMLLSGVNFIMSLTPLGLQKSLLLPSIHNDGEGAARVRQVECSAGFTVVLTRSGRVLSYGNNKYGKLGVGHLNADSDWHLLDGEISMHRITKIATGMNHVCALSEHGALFTWGRCDRGQLGHGSNLQDCHSPTPIQLAGAKVVDVSAGTAHTCIVLEDGSAYVWGKFHSRVPRVNSIHGQEYGYFCDQLLPRKIVIDAKIVSCVSNSHQTALIDSDDKIYVFGLKSQNTVDMDYRSLSPEEVRLVQNEPMWKQMEIRQKENRSRMVHDPVLVTGHLLEGKKVVKLCAGVDHLYALFTDGSMVRFAVGETEVKEFPLSKGLHVLDYSEGWYHNHFIVPNEATN